MSPSRPFIERPVATALLMVAIVLAGLVGFRFLPLSALPEVDYPTIQVTTLYPGASPDVMSRTVTAPLARPFRQMSGRGRLRRTSATAPAADDGYEPPPEDAQTPPQAQAQPQAETQTPASTEAASTVPQAAASSAPSTDSQAQVTSQTTSQAAPAPAPASTAAAEAAAMPKEQAAATQTASAQPSQTIAPALH